MGGPEYLDGYFGPPIGAYFDAVSLIGGASMEPR
jgi:hypothetical protein